jgi:hypothetical protein
VARSGSRSGCGRLAGSCKRNYLALGLVNVICVLSPALTVIGGGLMSRPELLDSDDLLESDRGSPEMR